MNYYKKYIKYKSKYLGGSSYLLLYLLYSKFFI